MSWKLLVALATAIAAAPAGPPATIQSACVLQRNTAVEQFQLSTLDELFGEVLSTESNGNIYIVSICQPIHKFYDPKMMAGAIKLTSDGLPIELGRIDQSNVVVNENDIVLSYAGGNIDKNPRDTCKGLKWNTYLTFVCYPNAFNDVLTLIDEDPNQPEICQVWFEIKTSKMCDRHPYMPLAMLEKDLSSEIKQFNNEEEIKRKIINSNEISFANRYFNGENNKLIPDQNSSTTETAENNSIQNHSQNNNFEYKPFVNVYPDHIIIGNKSINDKNKENNFRQISSKDKSFENKKNNSSHYIHNDVVKKNESVSQEIKNENFTKITSKEHSFHNNKPSSKFIPKHEQNTKILDYNSFRRDHNENDNIIIKHENKNGEVAPNYQLPENKKPSDNENRYEKSLSDKDIDSAKENQSSKKKRLPPKRTA